MNKNLNETLASLAMLRVDINQRHTDYLDYLVPFIQQILAHRAGLRVDDNSVASAIADEYGLKIPVATVHLVLKRVARSGLIRKDHGGYSVVRDIANNGLNDRRSVAANKISTVVNGLVDFAQSQFGKVWTDQDATTAVIAFLSRFSIECLRTFERGTALPEIEDDNQSEIYIVSKFLKWAHSEHEDLFRKAMILVKGHMLANALLCPDLESIQKNFKHVIFYVDTTLLLNIIDLGCQVSQEAAAELFKLIEVLEGSVAIFSHTIDELKSVIGAAANHVALANTEMPAALAARRQGLRQSDLLIMAEDVEQRLLGHGLKVKSTPRATQAFQISESELQSAIEHEVNYGNPRALEYDINSIRSVYELRGGGQPRRLEDARAVLLTENTALARAAFEFGKKHSPGSAVSAVITDFSLANVAWLKAPAAIPDLPEREVLSACYAALEPDQATWAHYLEEIDRLEVAGKISSDEHQLLRYSALAREGVADLTIGREQALTAGDVDELMKRLKHDMSRAAEAERAKTQRELYLERSRAQTMKENERRMISRIGVLGAWLGRVGRTGFLLCMAGVFFLISLLANGLLDMYAPKLSGAHMLLGIFLLLTAIFWAFDFTPKGVGVRIGRCVERMAIRRLRKWLNVSPDMDPREHELHE